MKLSIHPHFAADIDAYSLSTLIDLYGVRKMDLLKIDFEKSELELVSSNTESWLPLVRNICIEPHGPDREDVFRRALSSYSYRLSRPGDLTICRDLQMLH